MVSSAIVHHTTKSTIVHSRHSTLTALVLLAVDRLLERGDVAEREQEQHDEVALVAYGGDLQEQP